MMAFFSLEQSIKVSYFALHPPRSGLCFFAPCLAGGELCEKAVKGGLDL